MDAVPVDVTRGLIAARQSEVQSLPGRRDAHHAAAGGQPLAPGAPRSRRMEHDGVIALGGEIQTFDARARFRLCRISARRQHDAGRSILGLVDVKPAQTLVVYCFEDFRKIALEPNQNCLSFRITKAHVVLEHARAVRG